MGALLQHFFAVKWGLFPIAQYKGLFVRSCRRSGLGFYTMASVSRIMRAEYAGGGPAGLYQDGALRRGFPKFRVTWKHQIRNAIMPVVRSSVRR